MRKAAIRSLRRCFGEGLALTCATVGGVAVIFHKCRLVAVEKPPPKKTHWSNCASIVSVPQLVGVPEHTTMTQRRRRTRSCCPALGRTHAVVDLGTEGSRCSLVSLTFGRVWCQSARHPPVLSTRPPTAWKSEELASSVQSVCRMQHGGTLSLSFSMTTQLVFLRGEIKSDI